MVLTDYFINHLLRVNEISEEDLKKYTGRPITKGEFKALMRKCSCTKSGFILNSIIANTLAIGMGYSRFIWPTSLTTDCPPVCEIVSLQVDKIRDLTQVFSDNLRQENRKQNREIDRRTKDLRLELMDLRAARDTELSCGRARIYKGYIQRDEWGVADYRPDMYVELNEFECRVRSTYKQLIQRKKQQITQVKKEVRAEHRKYISKAQAIYINETLEYIWLFYEENVRNRKMGESITNLANQIIGE